MLLHGTYSSDGALQQIKGERKHKTIPVFFIFPPIFVLARALPSQLSP